MDLNKVMLIWRITNDVELKKIEGSGNSVINFTLATNRRFKNRDWNQIEEAEFHRCVVFGNLADVLGKYGEKGKRMYIEWRLRTRKWEDTNWNSRFTTEIIIENFIFLDSRSWGSELVDQELPTVETELPF